MPEKINDIKVFSLSDVAKSIQKTLAERYTTSFWVKAELNKLNFYKQSGHCFPELVEKKDGRIVAQMRSVIWRDDFIQINNRFLTVLNEPLKDGVKILFQASISFDVLFGLSLHILDIDPAYTLGDLEREKQETIKKLRGEGLFEKNKTRPLPLLPQRIAIISVETSKGYADFLKVISTNNRNYKFFHLLFPSLLQGEKAVASIIGQLQRIRKVISHFDVVAIIRGGGDDIGLSCFNNYFLSREIALFPIPVITGIGHATNETVAEMISFSNAITPTKLAEYLLQIFDDFAEPVQRAKEKISDKSLRLLKEEKAKFQSEVKLFRAATENVLQRNRNEMKIRIQSLFHQSNFRFRNEKTGLYQLNVKISAGSIAFLKNSNGELLNAERNINNMKPENVLKRGFSITLLNGKAVKNFEEVKTGDRLHTRLFEGNIDSIVESSGNQDHHE